MNKTKAFIFDLDDTLYDCTGLLTEAARQRAAKAMVEAGLPCSVDEAYRMQIELAEKYGPEAHVFESIAELHQMEPDALTKTAMRAYNSEEVDEVHPFPDVAPTLRELRLRGYKVFLITSGLYARQERKVRLLGLGELFDDVIINDSELGTTHEECFLELLHRHGLRPQQVVSVGDRIRAELKISKSLGMTTVQMLHGRFQDLAPHDELERPDYRIRRIAELLHLIHFVDRKQNGNELRVVAIGGGTGLPILLEGMKEVTSHLTAVVTVTDSGRSSGQIRTEFSVLPPGDMRNCLVALSESEKLLHDLFQYRFENGSLQGMSFGNLFIATLAKVTGSFEQAIGEASRILAIRGRVLPSTLHNTHICARLADGSTVEQEVNVRGLNKPAIQEVYLEPANASAYAEAVEEIRHADLIAIGPGSLYTSVVSNLLVEGIAEAIRQSDAVKVYVCNIVTQPGQTDGYAASDHVRTILHYLGGDSLDYAVLNSNRPPEPVLERYRKENADVVTADPEVHSLGVEIVEEDLVEDIQHMRILWEKQDLLRHDPAKLAHLLRSLVK